MNDSTKTDPVDEWVDVVDGEGNPIPENPRVPRTWLGTSLLPEGAKRAPKQTEPPASGDSSTRAAELDAREQALDAREKALQEREAALTEGADTPQDQKPDTPATPAKTATKPATAAK